MYWRKLTFALCLIGGIAISMMIIASGASASWIHTVDSGGIREEFFRQNEAIRYSYDDTGEITDDYRVEIRDSAGNVDYSSSHLGSTLLAGGYWSSSQSGEYTISFRPNEQIANIKSKSILFQCSDPYPDGYSETWYVNETGATYLRLFFEYIDIQVGDDLRLYDADGTYLQRYTSDTLVNHYTPWFNTDSIRLELSTDSTGSARGFKITKVFEAEDPYQNIQWKARSIESPHPYDPYYSDEWIISHPGAGAIRVHIDNLSLDEDDYIRIYDATGSFVASYGNGGTIFEMTDLITDWVHGDTVRITFTSDGVDETDTPWGFLISGYDHCTIIDTTISSSTFSIGSADIQLDASRYGQGDTMTIKVRPEFLPLYTVLVEDSFGFALQNWSDLTGDQILQLYLPAYWDSDTYYVRVYYVVDPTPVRTEAFDVQLFEVQIMAARDEYESYYGPGETVRFFFNIYKLSDGSPYTATIGWSVPMLSLFGMLENITNGTIEIPLTDDLSIPIDSYTSYAVHVWVAEGEEHNISTSHTFRVGNFGCWLSVQNTDPLPGDTQVIAARAGIMRYGSVYTPRSGMSILIEISSETLTRSENVIMSRELTSDHEGYVRWVFLMDSLFEEGGTYTVKATLSIPGGNFTDVDSFRLVTVDDEIYIDYIIEKSRYNPGELLEVTYWVTDSELNELSFTGTYHIYGHFIDDRIEPFKTGQDNTGTVQYVIPDRDGLHRISFDIWITENTKKTFQKRSGWVDVRSLNALVLDPGSMIYEASDSRTVSVLLKGGDDWTSPTLFIDVRSVGTGSGNVLIHSDSSSGTAANFTFSIPDNPPTAILITSFANDQSGHYLTTSTMISRKGDSSASFPSIALSTDRDRYDPGDVVTVTIETDEDFYFDDDVEFTVCSQGSEISTIAYGNIDEDELYGKRTYSFSFEIPESAKDGEYHINVLTAADTPGGWGEINMQSSFRVGPDEDEGSFIPGVTSDSPLLLVFLLIPIIISIVAIILVLRSQEFGLGSASGSSSKKSSETGPPILPPVETAPPGPHSYTQPVRPQIPGSPSVPFSGGQHVPPSQGQLPHGVIPGQPPASPQQVGQPQQQPTSPHSLRPMNSRHQPIQPQSPQTPLSQQSISQGPLPGQHGMQGIQPPQGQRPTGQQAPGSISQSPIQSPAMGSVQAPCPRCGKPVIPGAKVCPICNLILT